MRKSFILEDINSRNYRLNITEKSEGGGKTTLLVIQHTIVPNLHVSFSGSKALGIYKELKKMLRGGKTPQFNAECAALIAEAKKPEPEVKPTNQLIIKLYAGDVLVREINSEEAWIAALNTTIKVA